MGRKTFESIGRPLSGRTNIVLTRQEGYIASGCVIVHHLKSAFSACTGADEAFICGGENIFRQTVALVDRIYLTIIHRLIDGDAFFPEIPPVFIEVGREEVQDVMPYALVRYDRFGGQECVKSHDTSFDLAF